MKFYMGIIRLEVINEYVHGLKDEWFIVCQYMVKKEIVMEPRSSRNGRRVDSNFDTVDKS